MKVKKLFGVVLCLCMIFSMMSTVAFADSFLDTAPTLYANGDEVVLMAYVDGANEENIEVYAVSMNVGDTYEFSSDEITDLSVSEISVDDGFYNAVGELDSSNVSISENTITANSGGYALAAISGELSSDGSDFAAYVYVYIYDGSNIGPLLESCFGFGDIDKFYLDMTVSVDYDGEAVEMDIDVAFDGTQVYVGMAYDEYQNMVFIISNDTLYILSPYEKAGYAYSIDSIADEFMAELEEYYILYGDSLDFDDYSDLDINDYSALDINDYINLVFANYGGFALDDYGTTQYNGETCQYETYLLSIEEEDQTVEFTVYFKDGIFTAVVISNGENEIKCTLNEFTTEVSEDLFIVPDDYEIYYVDYENTDDEYSEVSSEVSYIDDSASDDDDSSETSSYLQTDNVPATGDSGLTVIPFVAAMISALGILCLKDKKKAE